MTGPARFCKRARARMANIPQDIESTPLFNAQWDRRPDLMPAPCRTSRPHRTASAAAAPGPAAIPPRESPPAPR
jgi:hypothetical protein